MNALGLCGADCGAATGSSQPWPCPTMKSILCLCHVKDYRCSACSTVPAGLSHLDWSASEHATDAAVNAVGQAHAHTLKVLQLGSTRHRNDPGSINTVFKGWALRGFARDEMEVPPALETLDLSHCQALEVHNLKHIARLPGLTTVILRHAFRGLDTHDMSALVHHLTAARRLTHLDLQGITGSWNSSATARWTLDISTHLTALTHLNLGHLITTAEQLGPLTSLTNLTSLTFHHGDLAILPVKNLKDVTFTRQRPPCWLTLLACSSPQVEVACEWRVCIQLDGASEWPMPATHIPTAFRLACPLGQCRVHAVGAGDGPLQLLLGHTASATSVSWSPDGRCLLSGSADGSQRVWDGVSGALVWDSRSGEALPDDFAVVGGVSHEGGGVGRVLCWGPDPRCIACCGSGGLQLWDRVSGERHTLLPSGIDAVPLQLDCAWGILRAHQVDGQHKGQLCGSVVTLSWSPNGRMLAAVVCPGSDDHGGSARVLTVWDVHSLAGICRKVISEIDGQDLPTGSLCWSPDSITIAAVTNGGRSVSTWERRPCGMSADTWRHGHKLDINGLLPCSADVHRPTFTCLTCSCNGALLAAGTSTSAILLWDMASGKLLRKLESCSPHTHCLSWCPDSRLLAASCRSSALVTVWDACTGGRLWELRGHLAPVLRVAWSPRGTSLASASEDNTLMIWDVQELCTAQHAGGSDNNSMC